MFQFEAHHSLSQILCHYIPVVHMENFAEVKSYKNPKKKAFFAFIISVDAADTVNSPIKETIANSMLPECNLKNL